MAKKAERADLSGKRLVGASFAYANLRDANFDNAILINANFTKDAYSRHRRGVEQLLQPDTYGAG